MAETRYILSKWQAENVDEDGEILSILANYVSEDAPEPFESFDDLDDDDLVTVIGRLRPASDGGYVWGVEDTAVGPVDGGWEPSLLKAVRAHVKCAHEWAKD